MGVKQYGIKWTIDDASAQAAFKRGAASLRELDKLSTKTVGSMEAAINRVGKAYEGAGKAAVNGHSAVATAANASAGAQIASVDRITKATQAGSAKRLKAAVAEQEKVDVGYYKVAFNGIKYQDKLTAATEKTVAFRQRVFDKAQKSEHDRQVASVREVEKAAEKRDAIESAFVARDYKRRVAAEKRKESAALGPYGRLADVRRKDLSEEQLQLAAKNKAQDAAHNKRINQILKEKYGTQDNFRESIAAAIGLDRAASSAGQALIAVGATAGAIKLVAGALFEARENAKKLGESTLDFMVRLRPLASVMGVKPDQKFAERIAGFGKETGLGKEGGADFLESFLGRAQITKGRQISEKEFDKFAIEAGKLAAQKGIPNDVAGDLFGATLKTENFQAKGQGAKEATARAAGALKILDAGSGKMPVLGPELNKAIAELTSEDKLEGVFRNVGEAAVAISTAAEHNPAEAGTLVSRTIIGLRDFENKDKKEFFKRAGITDKDSGLEAIAKANKMIGEEVRKGVPVDTAIKGFGFTEARETRGLKTFYNARDTVLKPQLANLAATMAPGAAEKTEAEIAARMGDQDMQYTVAKAGADAAKLKPDATDATILRNRAEEQLVKENFDTTWGGTLRQRMLAVASFGSKTGRDAAIDIRALEMARSEAGVASPIGFSGAGEILLGDTSEQLRLLVEQMKKNNALMEAANKKNNPPVAAAPGQIVTPQPQGQVGR